MAEILQFPAPASKLGYKRVRKRAPTGEDPAQLQLFASSTAQLLQLRPESGWFEQALLLDERGDPKAVELYQKAIAEQDCMADCYCNLGIIESQRGNTAQAFDCFTNSLKHNPRHTEAHYNLGNLYFDLNDFRLAQLHYELARETDPGFASIYFNLALVQAINHELAAAVATLTQYQALVSKAEGQKADELLENLRRSLAAVKKARGDDGLPLPSTGRGPG